MSGHAAVKFSDLDTTNGFRLGDLRSPAYLAASLRGSIIGQDTAVDAVVRAVTIAAAGLHDPHRPIASLLLVGPTGVGKTELARQVAHHIRGDADNLCRVDMNSLAQEHYAASLSGAPPGYAGSKEQFTLFDRDKVEGSLSRREWCSSTRSRKHTPPCCGRCCRSSTPAPCVWLPGPRPSTSVMRSCC